MYIYTLIAHSLFQPGFAELGSSELVNTHTLKDAIPESTCDTLFHCLWTVINIGFRNGAGIGDLMYSFFEFIKKKSIILVKYH